MDLSNFSFTGSINVTRLEVTEVLEVEIKEIARKLNVERGALN